MMVKTYEDRDKGRGPFKGWDGKAKGTNET